MVRVLIHSFVIAVTFLAAACSDDDKVNRNTIDYFEAHIQNDMSHEKLMFVFGVPDKDVGSGIHIYVYRLDDSTEVWIGITDKILYANQVDKDQNLLKVLI